MTRRLALVLCIALLSLPLSSVQGTDNPPNRCTPDHGVWSPYTPVGPIPVECQVIDDINPYDQVWLGFDPLDALTYSIKITLLLSGPSY